MHHAGWTICRRKFFAAITGGMARENFCCFRADFAKKWIGKTARAGNNQGELILLRSLCVGRAGVELVRAVRP
jgi:hypothetical protein